MLALEILIEEFIQLVLLDWDQGIDLGAEVVGIWYEFDGMVPLLLIGKLIERLSENVLEFLIWFGHYVFEACGRSTPEASMSFWEMFWVAPISSSQAPMNQTKSQSSLSNSSGSEHANPGGGLVPVCAG